MRPKNPYEPTQQTSTSIQSTGRKRSWFKRGAVGATLGAAPPALIGAHGLLQFNAFAASLPPGEAACGCGALGPAMMVVFVAPFLAMVGAAIALLLP